MRLIFWFYCISTFTTGFRYSPFTSSISRSPGKIGFTKCAYSLFSSSVGAKQRASSTDDFMDLIRSNETISIRDLLIQLPIEELKLTELKDVMRKLGVPPSSLRKPELKAILNALKNSEEFPSKREMPRRFMSNMKALNVLANKDKGIEVIAQHATPLRIKKIKDGDCFWRLYSELEDDTSGYLNSRSDLVEAFKEENLYGLEIKGNDLYFLLPCLCIVKDSTVSVVWTHTRARRKGFGIMLMKLLKVRNVYNPSLDSIPFWKACGLHNCEGVQTLMKEHIARDYKLLF